MRVDELRDVTLEVSDGVATVTLNRPHRRNAWTGRMALDYRWALHFADADPSVAAIVVTGAGESFCVGADTDVLDEVQGQGGNYQRRKAELPPWPDDAPAGLRRNHTYPLVLGKPVLAAINGACAGAGLILATYADIRYAAAGAKITASFAGLGLPAEYGIGWMLPRIVGSQAAAEMLLLNPVLTAEEAFALGFVHAVLPAETLLEDVRTRAGAARQCAPSSLRVMKRQLHVDAWGELGAAYDASVTDMNEMLRGSDFAEGLAAMRERRAREFRPAPPPEQASA